MGIVTIPMYLMTSDPFYLLTGSFVNGLGGPGMWGVITTYLSERFPTVARGAGAGFAYHAGAAVGAATPYLIGRLKDQGVALSTAMGMFIGISNFLAIVLIFAGPETKGREFKALDEHDQNIGKPVTVHRT
jgi:MFS family permease